MTEAERHQQLLVHLAGMQLLFSVCRGTPILYLHVDDDSPPFGVLISARAYADLLALVPEGDDVTKFVTAHGHLTG